MRIRQSTDVDILHVVQNMREQSAVEAYESAVDRNPLAIVHAVIAASRRQLVLRTLAADDDRPCALVGIGWTGPGRATIMFVATSGFPAIMIPAHRWWRRSFVPEIMALFRRVEFIGSVPNSPSGRWLKSVGFVCEGIARSYGTSGENFAYWGWVNPKWPRIAPSPTVDGLQQALGSAALEIPKAGEATAGHV